MGVLRNANRIQLFVERGKLAEEESAMKILTEQTITDLRL
jgi:hypothetical protein